MKMKDCNGNEVPPRPEILLCDAFYNKYQETKNKNLRFTEWGTYFTSECCTLTCRNTQTYDFLVIRLWFKDHPVTTFDIIGHCQEAIDFAKPIMEKHVKNMYEYYLNCYRYQKCYQKISQNSNEDVKALVDFAQKIGAKEF